MLRKMYQTKLSYRHSCLDLISVAIHNPKMKEPQTAVFALLELISVAFILTCGFNRKSQGKLWIARLTVGFGMLKRAIAVYSCYRLIQGLL